MREQFDRQLAELRQELVSIFVDVDVELHEAVDALVERDAKKAKSVKRDTRAIDERCADLEDRAYNLIVLQQPVASDLRLLEFIIYVDFNLARMSNHARNIAKTAKRCAGLKVPGQLLDLLASEAHLVYRVLSSTAEAIVESDLALASSLPELDKPVDDVYKQFFRTFASLGPKDDIDAATRIIMSARMLERISDNSVEAGERLVFLLTGRRRSLYDLADLDEEEIDDLYAAKGAGLTYDAETDLRVAERIPELDLASVHPSAFRQEDDDYDEPAGARGEGPIAPAAKADHVERHERESKGKGGDGR